MKKITLLIIIFLLLFFLTSPTLTEFNSFISNDVKYYPISKKDMYKESSNYFLFKIFIYSAVVHELEDDTIAFDEYHFIGILGNFFLIKKKNIRTGYKWQQ